MGYTINKLYDTISAPAVSKHDALAERLQSVGDTAYLLYQKTKEKLRYGQTMKDTVKNKAAAEEAKEQE